MRITATIMALFMILALAVAPAQARNTSEAATDNAGGVNPYRNIPKSMRVEALNKLAAFKQEIRDLTDRLEIKHRQLSDLFDRSDINETRAQGLAREINALRSEIFTKNVDFKIQFFKDYGVSLF